MWFLGENFLEWGLLIFCVLLRSVCSFMFFAKERRVLCILLCSLEKNGKECIVLLGFISCQKERKRTLCSLKEQKVQNGKEHSAQPVHKEYVYIYLLNLSFALESRKLQKKRHQSLRVHPLGPGLFL